MAYVPLGAQRFDVIVFGAGYAGFAAALTCHRAGRRTLLVDRHGAVVHESGWSFSRDTGDTPDPLWREWRARLAAHAGDGGEGAIAEVLATSILQDERLPALYYASVVSAGRTNDGRLSWVSVATKAGLKRLLAGQWIDATDAGELVRVLVPGWKQDAPLSQAIHLHFRHPHSLPLDGVDLPSPAGGEASLRLRWRPGAWKNEHVLSLQVDGSFAHPRAAWLPALRTLHSAMGRDLATAVLTHGSVVPYSAYPSRVDVNAGRGLPENVSYAGTNGATHAEKFRAGIGCARNLENQRLPKSDGSVPEHATAPVPAGDIAADVGVAGIGTGGAVAAIAAARAGANVAAFEAMPFPGGVGTGAGIHFYYFGVKGGLQQELDTRVREIMPLFGTPAQVGGFHPEAKKQVLDAMLSEAGVQLCYQAQLCCAGSSAGRVTEVDVATPFGLVRSKAKAWIDATGDGDLAARAGAKYRLGRRGDGLLHAYGQSSGRAQVVNGSAKLRIMNFDAGFCDPTDEQDLTRARLTGVHTYLQATYDPDERPTYIAPAIGLRQSRHIETEYTLSLDDLINRQRFPDAIGYTGCHYDNHARDYEFESDEAAFWVWVCHQWYGRLACEIPYRMLLPRGLRNVLVACRAAGVSEEAHHSFRMQRDMQRLGEAAGIAAALAAKRDVDCGRIPFAELEGALIRSGALSRETFPDRSFGHHADSEHFTVKPGRLHAWLAELRGGPATEALWHLYRAGEQARTEIVSLLPDPDPAVSWRAAAILAMWGDPLAEPRLELAIRNREDDRARDITTPQQEWFYAPRWYAAITLLKRCLTRASIPVLAELAATPEMPLNARCAVALACEALALRHRLSGEERARCEHLLDRLLASDAPRSVRNPQGSPFEEDPPPAAQSPTDLRPVTEDYRWQLHLAVLRARLAAGLTPHAAAYPFASDIRSVVRRRFTALLPQPGAHAPVSSDQPDGGD